MVETDGDNENRIIRALLYLPDQAVKELKMGEIDQYEVVRVVDEIVVDLMKRACGIEYAEASKSIVTIRIEGVDIPFASRDLMTRLKASVRPKDQMDLEFLKQPVS